MGCFLERKLVWNAPGDVQRRRRRQLLHQDVDLQIDPTQHRLDKRPSAATSLIPAGDKAEVHTCAVCSGIIAAAASSKLPKKETDSHLPSTALITHPTQGSADTCTMRGCEVREGVDCR